LRFVAAQLEASLRQRIESGPLQRCTGKSGAARMRRRVGDL
jgi:hypothetical protein